MVEDRLQPWRFPVWWDTIKLNQICSWKQRLCLVGVCWRFTAGWYECWAGSGAWTGGKREDCGQYARVFTGAQCARVCPGWSIQATGPPPCLLLQDSLCFFATQMSATISRARFWELRVRHIEQKAQQRCTDVQMFAFTAVGSDIFVWRRRPCLISPQPAVQSATGLCVCVWRQQGSSGRDRHFVVYGFTF